MSDATSTVTPVEATASLRSKLLAKRARALRELLPELLAFRAPYLETKLVRLGIVPDEAAGHELFQEVKKYLVLSDCLGGRELPMFSARVDAGWHQFVLFTSVYARFCARFHGQFMHHNPAEASEGQAAAADAEAISFEEFQAVYASFFGAMPEAIWLDERSLTPDTPLCWSSWAVPLVCKAEPGCALLCRAGGEPHQTLCRVQERARPALEFIAGHRCFFVRELPGLRHDRERVELCRPLVQVKVLSLAL